MVNKWSGKANINNRFHNLYRVERLGTDSLWIFGLVEAGRSQAEKFEVEYKSFQIIIIIVVYYLFIWYFEIH